MVDPGTERVFKAFSVPENVGDAAQTATLPAHFGKPIILAVFNKHRTNHMLSCQKDSILLEVLKTTFKNNN